MKNFILLHVIALYISVSLFAGTYSGGDGSAGNPYQINDLDDLWELSNTPGDWTMWDYFIQTADIDASSTNGWNYPYGFAPIGNLSTYFAGSYNGQGYTVSGIYINRNSTYHIGFFGYTGGGTIQNLGVINVNITGNVYVGGLIGYSTSATINNCYSTGIVNGSENVGGLVGGFFGGFVKEGSLSSCYSSVDVDGTNNIGGLFGRNGGSYNTQISNSYCTGSVDGNDLVGGFSGASLSPSIVENCYSSGLVTGNSRFGGFMGFNNATVNNSFWDTETSGQSSSAGGTGKTTSQMKTQSTFSDAGWDFENTWNINGTNNDGYPYLQWEVYESEEIGSLYISEVSDAAVSSKPPFSTGFIELWNDTGVEVSLDGHSILRGTNDGSGFVGDGTSYTIPVGYTIPVDGFFVIANGAPLDNFNSEWGISLTEAQFDKGSFSLQLTNGYAYALDDGTRVIIDETVEVNSEERIYQETVGNWIVETPATGTPGGLGGDEPLPVTLSSFTGIYANGSSLLQWTTQSESNNQGWNVYRSESENITEGIQVNGVMIDGAGTSNVQTNYSYEDAFTVQTTTTVNYWLESVDYSGNSEFFGPIPVLIEHQQDNPDAPEIPIVLGLHQNYPNPFNPDTKIKFAVEEAGNAEVAIFNLKGQKIATLFSGEVEADTYYETVWSGRDDNGKEVASGVYLYRLNSSGKNETKRMMLIK
jgi:hypothetical protein